MKRRFAKLSLPKSLVATALLSVAGISLLAAAPPGNRHDGRYIFRYDTFGDEQLWTDILRMHEVVQAAVSPKTALSVGLKVDSEALPPNFLARADLDDPTTTVEEAMLMVDAIRRAGGRAETEWITGADHGPSMDRSLADPGFYRWLERWTR